MAARAEFTLPENRRATVIKDQQIDEYYRLRTIGIECGQNRAHLVVCTHDFQPNNRKAIANLGNPSARVVYCDTSVIAAISTLQPEDSHKDDLFESAEKVTLEKARNQTTGCELSGTAHDKDVQLSGAHITIIGDGNDPSFIESTSFCEAASHLFGPAGPLKDIVIIPSAGQEKLIDSIAQAGGRTLLHGPEGSSAEYSITHPQYKELLEYQEYLLRRTLSMSGDIESVTHAFLAYLPMDIHMYNAMHMGREPSGTGDLFSYLKQALEDRLKKYFQELSLPTAPLKISV